MRADGYMYHANGMHLAHHDGRTHSSAVCSSFIPAACSLFTFICRSICECKYCTNSRFDFLVMFGSVRFVQCQPLFDGRTSSAEMRTQLPCLGSLTICLCAAAAGYSMVKLAYRISLALYNNIQNDNNAASVGGGGVRCTHSIHNTPECFSIALECFMSCASIDGFCSRAHTHTRVSPTCIAGIDR